MKGVVLAGGSGSRLYPLTKITNKHLLPIYNKPMIYYPIQTLVDAGIKDILIVTGGRNAGDFLRLLANGKEFGLTHLGAGDDVADFAADRLNLQDSGFHRHLFRGLADLQLDIEAGAVSLAEREAALAPRLKPLSLRFDGVRANEERGRYELPDLIACEH